MTIARIIIEQDEAPVLIVDEYDSCCVCVYHDDEEEPVYIPLDAAKQLVQAIQNGVSQK